MIFFPPTVILTADNIGQIRLQYISIFASFIRFTDCQDLKTRPEEEQLRV